jgi:hypothetical protein
MAPDIGELKLFATALKMGSAFLGVDKRAKEWIEDGWSTKTLEDLKKEAAESEGSYTYNELKNKWLDMKDDFEKSVKDLRGKLQRFEADPYSQGASPILRYERKVDQFGVKGKLFLGLNSQQAKGYRIVELDYPRWLEELFKTDPDVFRSENLSEGEVYALVPSRGIDQEKLSVLRNDFWEEMEKSGVPAFDTFRGYKELKPEFSSRLEKTIDKRYPFDTNVLRIAALEEAIKREHALAVIGPRGIATGPPISPIKVVAVVPPAAREERKHIEEWYVLQAPHLPKQWIFAYKYRSSWDQKEFLTFDELRDFVNQGEGTLYLHAYRFNEPARWDVPVPITPPKIDYKRAIADNVSAWQWEKGYFSLQQPRFTGVQWIWSVSSSTYPRLEVPENGLLNGSYGYPGGKRTGTPIPAPKAEQHNVEKEANILVENYKREKEAAAEKKPLEPDWRNFEKIFHDLYDEGYFVNSNYARKTSEEAIEAAKGLTGTNLGEYRAIKIPIGIPLHEFNYLDGKQGLWIAFYNHAPKAEPIKTVSTPLYTTADVTPKITPEEAKEEAKLEKESEEEIKRTQAVEEEAEEEEEEIAQEASWKKGMPLTDDQITEAMENAIGFIANDWVAKTALATFDEKGRDAAINTIKGNLQHGGQGGPDSPDLTDSPKGVWVTNDIMTPTEAANAPPTAARLLTWGDLLNFILANRKIYEEKKAAPAPSAPVAKPTPMVPLEKPAVVTKPTVSTPSTAPAAPAPRPTKILSSEDMRLLQDYWNTQFIRAIGKVPAGFSSVFRIEFQEVKTLPFAEAKNAILAAADREIGRIEQEQRARVTIRQGERITPGPSKAPARKPMTDREIEEENEEGFRMPVGGKVPPSFFPPNPLSVEQPFPRGPTSLEQLRLWQVFCYEMQTEGYDCNQYAREFTEYINKTQFYDWEDLKENFTFFVDTIMEGATLPPLVQWRKELTVPKGIGGELRELEPSPEPAKLTTAQIEMEERNAVKRQRILIAQKAAGLISYNSYYVGRKQKTMHDLYEEMTSRGVINASIPEEIFTPVAKEAIREIYHEPLYTQEWIPIDGEEELSEKLNIGRSAFGNITERQIENFLAT